VSAPRKTAPRLPRETKRQRRSAEYEREWRKLRDARRRSVAGQKARILRGREFIRTLELAADATGDPRFTAALEAAKHFGFDKELHRNLARAQEEMFGRTDEMYLVQIEFLHSRGKLEFDPDDGVERRHKLSIREACEAVVAESGLPGHSFAHVVGRLRQLYMARAVTGKVLVRNPRRRKTIPTE
jgi:hypothetical protein